ncbi:MAG: hypothetical protein E7397_08520 [Ruminococcaceae bacterium]|nr:hypothetical protein [Oscillospiraceae bacterium]
MNNIQISITYTDGSSEQRIYPVNNGLLTVKKNDFSKDVKFIDVLSEHFTASAGEEGYFIVPNIADILDNEHAVQIFFRKRPDCNHVFTASNMPIFAVCDGSSSILAICKGMHFEYDLIAEVKDGKYCLFPRYNIEDVDFYEDITIRFFAIEDANWCAIARKYREYQLETGACQTLRERVKTNKVLEQAAKGIEVRCRLAHKEGWTNVPKEQTLENEPDLHIYADFKRMEDVVDALADAGCHDANFCIVGWNICGMDGRYPDYFPVEPRLGGEEGLRRLIEKTKSKGFLIGAHTNSMISFTISQTLDQNDFLFDKDGTNYIWGVASGGNCHVMCDKQAYEKYMKKTQEEIGALGFTGINFIDQITIFKPRTCYNPLHPITKTEVAEYRKKLLQSARDAVGCSSSEGGFDFCIGSYDWAMYPVIRYEPELPEICDNTIPFWYLVYHGIVLYNAFPKTVNAMMKAPEYELITVEYGARPLAYLHARVFEYEGEPNFTCTTDEELKENAKIIGEGCKRYDKLVDLQYEFFDEHRKLADGVIYTQYSNGTVIVVNYNDTDYIYENQSVPAKSYLRIDA